MNTILTTCTKSLSDQPAENMAKLDERIGFVGGGNMAFAIGSGLIERGMINIASMLITYFGLWFCVFFSCWINDDDGGMRHDAHAFTHIHPILLHTRRYH